MINVSLVKKG